MNHTIKAGVRLKNLNLLTADNCFCIFQAIYSNQNVSHVPFLMLSS